MKDYAERTALGVGNKTRSEVQSDEESPSLPEMTKDLDDISLDEVPDGEIEDLLKYEYANDIGEVRHVTLTEKSDVKAPEDTTTYTDNGLQPGRTYEHRIEAFTDDAEATSGTVQTTATSSGVRQRRVPSSGWYVEIDIDT